MSTKNNNDNNNNNNISGWCITFYSDIDQDNARGADFPYLSWSSYDRVDIKKHTHFKNFIFSEDDNKWCGVRQQLHLIPEYAIRPNLDTLFYNDDEWKIRHNINNKQYLISNVDDKAYGLNCVITVRLNDKILENLQYNENISKKDILHNVVMNINNYCRNFKLTLDIIAFTSLGSEDFAFILLSDKIETFDNILQIINKQSAQLNSIDADLFKGVSSMLDYNTPGYSYQPALNAIVKVSAINADKIKNIVENVQAQADCQANNIRFIQGKGDFEITFNPKNLYLWTAEQNGFLNRESANNFYKENIINSRTFWSSNQCLIDNDSEIYLKTSFSFNTDNNKSSKINNQQVDNEEAINNSIARFILAEYNRLIHSKKCTEWKNILLNQQTAFKECVLKFASTQYESDLLDEMQLVLTHINQACTPIYEVPYHNYGYSGSFNDILKMYYCIIEAIFNKGYQIPREEQNKASLLAFGIRFNSVDKIETLEFSTNFHENRIVIFRLPYSALYDIELTIKLLVHEVFHYVAPINRFDRNNGMIRLWTRYITLKCNEFLINNNYSEITINYIKNIDFFEKVFSELYNIINISNDRIEQFAQYELSNFQNAAFAEKIFLYSIISIGRIIEREKFKIAQNSTLSCKEFSVSDFINELINWCNQKDIIAGMIELSYALKEIFCDLFMHKMCEITFEEYLNILIERYSSEFERTIKTDDISVAYRIAVIAKIMKRENESGIYCTISQTIKEIKECTTDTNNNKSKKINTCTLIMDSLKQVSSSNHLINEFCNILSKEIIYLDTCNEFNLLGNKTLKELLSKNNSSGINNQDISSKIELIDFINNSRIKKITLDKSDKAIPHYSISLDSKNINERKDYIYSLGEYINRICKIANDDSELWYRGVCNCEYDLTPSLFRNCNNALSLYANQVNILKLAYSYTTQYPDMWKGTISEQMSCMQHYGLPTNLLDFSLDMLTALHFALTPDKKEDRKALDDLQIIPAVYIFKPLEYIKAIDSLKNEQISNITIPVSPIMYDVATDDMHGYFPQKMDATYLIEHSLRYTKEYIPSPRTDLYPMPVIIRHSNTRVLVQGGTFMAFHLDAKPDKKADIKHKYSYLDLLNIQRNYTDLISKEIRLLSSPKFIEKIYIHPCCIGEIRSNLQTLGVSKSKVYPELHHIFENAREHYINSIPKSTI